MNPLIPRKEPSFGLDASGEHAIPRHWFDNDAFKSRLLDAMSVQFPDGERYFIACVRDYRDQIQDPTLQQRVKDFIYQEAQHGAAHERYNQRLAAQGVPVAKITGLVKARLAYLRRKLPAKVTLAHTSAIEHLTAVLAQSLLKNSEVTQTMHPSMRGLYLWHAVEELEHKSVAFEVYENVAKGGYWLRTGSLVWSSTLFVVVSNLILQNMLKLDGLNRRERLVATLKGYRWLLGERGLMRSAWPEYAAYYRRGFHPDQIETHAHFQAWQQVWNQTQDAVAAGHRVALAA
jgi:hypothetical protein